MSKEEISRAITRHLMKHPGACDTIVGIMTWWINADPLSVSEKDVQRALDELCHNGLLVKKEIINSRPLYSLKIRPA